MTRRKTTSVPVAKPASTTSPNESPADTESWWRKRSLANGQIISGGLFLVGLITGVYLLSLIGQQGISDKQVAAAKRDGIAAEHDAWQRQVDIYNGCLGTQVQRAEARENFRQGSMVDTEALIAALANFAQDQARFEAFADALRTSKQSTLDERFPPLDVAAEQAKNCQALEPGKEPPEPESLD